MSECVVGRVTFGSAERVSVPLAWCPVCQRVCSTSTSPTLCCSDHGAKCCHPRGVSAECPSCAASREEARLMGERLQEALDRVKELEGR